jgi:hypothetical protein
MSQPIATKDIPQADSLEKVMLTVEAVSKGKNSFQDIATYLRVTDRQGRYYRRAAEILRFIASVPHKNVSTLTPLGQQLLRKTGSKKTQTIATQILHVPIIQSVVGMLASSGGTATQPRLERSFRKIVPNTTRKMADRRLMTILSWLEHSNSIKRIDHQVILKKLPASVDKIEISDPDVPVLPKPGDMRLFEEVPRKIKKASAIVKFEVDRVKIERANATHEKLRTILANRIKRYGPIPTYNRYIDLAVRMENKDFIIEVKSAGNVRAQIRRGISQLYEYRYLQSLPNAMLVLLLEKPLIGENQWLLDYLVEDRGICVLWDAQDDELFTTDKCMEKLPFMQ